MKKTADIGGYRMPGSKCAIYGLICLVVGFCLLCGWLVIDSGLFGNCGRCILLQTTTADPNSTTEDAPPQKTAEIKADESISFRADDAPARLPVRRRREHGRGAPGARQGRGGAQRGARRVGPRRHRGARCGRQLPEVLPLAGTQHGRVLDGRQRAAERRRRQRPVGRTRPGGVR